MLNRCRFLNIALHICGGTGQSCHFMADPHSCPNYDEDMHRSYVEGYERSKMSSTKVAQAESERIESIKEFADRTEAELNGMGIKVVKEEEAPEWF